MTRFDEYGECLAAGRIGIDDDDVVAWHHHLVEGALRDLEGAVDDLALLRREGLVDGDHVAEFVTGDLLALAVRVAAEYPNSDVGRLREQPDDRLGQRRQDVERSGHHHAPLLGALHRDALGGEFAEHEGEVGEDERHEDDRHRSCRPAEKAQGCFEWFGERNGGGSRSEEAGQGDPDLDRGEELIRLAGEPGENGAGCRLLLQPLQLALAQRDEGELGAGERSIDQHEDRDEEQLWPDVTHVADIQARLMPRCSL